MTRKLYRYLFTGTFFVTIFGFGIATLYAKSVIRFSSQMFDIVLIITVAGTIATIGAIMLVHFIMLRFAVKLIAKKPEERYSRVEEWLRTDKKLSRYPRLFSMSVTIFYVLVLSSIGFVFNQKFLAISLRETVFTVFGGAFMGIISGGYYYFILKILLNPIRRELAPTEPPKEWKPTGGIRIMLTQAFFSIIMALTFFPLLVFFTKMQQSRIDIARHEAKIAIRAVNSELKSHLQPDAETIPADAVPNLLKYEELLGGKLVLIEDSSGAVLFGADAVISKSNMDIIKSQSSGHLEDKVSEDNIVFESIDNGMKAAIVFKRNLFIRYAYDSLWMMSVVLALALFMAIGLMMLVNRYIGNPIEVIVKDVEAISEGDFARAIHVSSDGELGVLERSLGIMKKRLVMLIENQRALVEQVASSVERLDQRAGELRAVAGEQAASAAEQASASQEARVTGEELKKTSELVTERIGAVNDMAAKTLDEINKGNKNASLTLEGIHQIEYRVKMIAEKMLHLGESIQRIGKIAETIDDIAKKTNLLAINAGIEAVGAGEAGERFGVVANEIRRFAGSTAKSAEEVRLQVEAIRKVAAESVIFTEEGTKSVAAGLQKVEAVAASFKSMEAISGKTSANAGEIAMSVKQQAGATEQMALTMTELNESAVQVAKGAKKIEAATMDLDKLAEELKQLLFYHGNLGKIG